MMTDHIVFKLEDKQLTFDNGAKLFMKYTDYGHPMKA